jgi:ankyrin repeat protein
MAIKAKRKTLPRDFEDLLKAGDLVKLQAVFEACDVNARGGYAKQVALAYDECPDDLARWLVAQGADIDAADTSGYTPLHTRARSWRGNIAVLLELGANVHADNGTGTPLHAAAARRNAETVRQLLARGARVDALNRDGRTPLEVAVEECTNAELHRMPEFVTTLLEAGAQRTPRMKDWVRRIGQQFETHRATFNPTGLAEASAGLDFLYATFDVPPVPRRRMHDGVSPIVPKTTGWQAQHSELWDLLVPGRGPAATVQGEVIRISGRIAGEWERNGGGNWDSAYEQMARAFGDYVRKGTPLSPSELTEADAIIPALQRAGAGHDRLAELAVAWVLRNPSPIPLGTPTYSR